MRATVSFLVGLLFLALSPIPLQAADGDAPPTLAAALAQAAPPAGGLALAVAADRVPLPPGEASPGPGATVPQVAAAFHRITQDFGDVTAVAPPTVPALNPDPHDPDPYDGMERWDVFTLLAASLDDAQWGGLTSSSGLGAGDLTSESQRQLFAALFPGGRLMIHQALTSADKAEAFTSAAASGLTPKQAEARLDAQGHEPGRDVSADLPLARLRLGSKCITLLPGDQSVASMSGDPDAPPRWEVMVHDQDAPKDTLYGVPVRADVPNVLKAGQLDLDAAALSSPVPVAPWKTVGALVASVARATHLELYADRRWEGKPLTVVGASQAQPARSLLRALAVCVGGAYRKVGPAYVLTYDVVGVGTIRHRWAEFSDDASAILGVPLDDARRHIAAAHSPDDITQTDDPMTLTAGQRRSATPVLDGEGFALDFARLTPGQQATVRHFVAQQQTWHDREQAFIQQHPDYKNGFPFDTSVPRTEGRIESVSMPEVDILLPSVQGPVVSNIYLAPSDIFGPLPKPETAPAPTRPTAPASLAAALAAVPRRAVFAHPRTADAVDALVVLLRKARMNALYLDVFSEGVSHLDASPDILDEALTKTRGTGIAVFPVMDLFGWSDTAPEGARDLNILGETSVQAAARRQARAAAPPSAPGPLFVSPTALDVRQTLLGLAQDVAARPGVAGLVWREANPPGYSSDPFTGGADLGYTEAARLAFLRRAHADPVDVTFRENSGANLGLPDFDGEGADHGLLSQWQGALATGHRALLNALLDAARPLTVFISRTGVRAPTDDWYGSWDAPKAPLPAYHNDDGPADAQAKAQSRRALLVLSPEWLLRPNAGALLRGKVQQTRWDGFVLDADAPRPDAKKTPLPLEAALAQIGAGLISSPPSPSGSPRPSPPPP